jgi:hypothetical protein
VTAGYRLECWRCGIIGPEPHPLRVIQAMLRARAAEADAIERWLILQDIRAFLADDTAID